MTNETEFVRGKESHALVTRKIGDQLRTIQKLKRKEVKREQT